MSGSKEQLNSDNITYRYSEDVLPDREPIHPCDKDYAIPSMCECPVKDTKVPK